MQYRKFGKLDWNISALGFGCMRLPTTDGIPFSDKVIEEEAIRMIRYAIDQGVNYVDTAYFYHNGQSEAVLGKALQDGYREKVNIATKAALFYIKKTSDFEKYLDEQLRRMQTDSFDMYLFHALKRGSWESLIQLKLLQEAEKCVAKGKIKYIGFSFHGQGDEFTEILNGYDNWTFCQIQYNYMDTHNNAGTKGLKLAASKGIAVSVMEPLLGGKLANPPRPIREQLEAAGEKRTPAELALQWIWNHPEVSVVLSGMTTMDQVKENLKSAENFSAVALAEKDHALVRKIETMFRERMAVPCTGCGYCLPCPNNVAIPAIFKLYNDGIMYESPAESRNEYQKYIPEHTKASACTQCGACEEKCTQLITISEWMPKLHKALNHDN